ncbi:MAG: SDR family NAD(P)-dependent oxidoreductase [Lachnospiraceae bacterium]|nr:SDR family NAD(P)-dependent oxidoreductase [Lachnospiraceae bacterium]
MNTKKNVLVTGSSRGIGRAIALKYAALGYQVILNCKTDTKRMEEVKQEAERLGGRCLAIQADVGRREECIRLFDTISRAVGPVDILVNNAGISHIGLLQEMEYDEWDRLLASNLSSVFYCCKLAIPGMVHKKSGAILNISSVWGICGASCEAAYSAAKGGINALTRALAKELAPSGISVNAIACGVIDTEMNRFLTDSEREALLAEIPAGRMGSAEEAADLAVRLTGTSSYLTGQIVALDGGWI